jgi:hypothetical protein
MQLSLLSAVMSSELQFSCWQFFRTVIGKKISDRPSNSTVAVRKYLDDGPKGKRRGDHHCRCEDKDGEDSCRWDKTDSECKSICNSSSPNAKILRLRGKASCFWQLLFWRYDVERISTGDEIYIGKTSGT